METSSASRLFARNCAKTCLTGRVSPCAAASSPRALEDGEPFDADGKGSSDLDLTLVGSKIMECWNEEEFYIPGLHTKPLGDKDPDIAPALNPLRESLQEMAGRPVNIQATSDLVLFARDVLFGQPYFTIIEAGEEDA